MFYFEKFMMWLEEADKTTPHESKYHKETFRQHTISVASKAAYCKDRQLFIAALLHDIGKPATVKYREDKGYVFYDHQDHIELIDEFLTKDDKDHDIIIDLVKNHMLPYTLKGPEPYKPYAEKVLLQLVQTHSAEFISKLFSLHTYDEYSTYGRNIETLIPEMRFNIYDYYDELCSKGED